MQMIRLAFSGWDAVNVNAAEPSSVRGKHRARLFHDFAASGVFDSSIFALDMTARQQPAIQALVMNQQERVTLRMQYQSGRGNVAGRELRA